MQALEPANGEMRTRQRAVMPEEGGVQRGAAEARQRPASSGARSCATAPGRSARTPRTSSMTTGRPRSTARAEKYPSSLSSAEAFSGRSAKTSRQSATGFRTGQILALLARDAGNLAHDAQGGETDVGQQAGKAGKAADRTRQRDRPLGDMIAPALPGCRSHRTRSEAVAARPRRCRTTARSRSRRRRATWSAATARGRGRACPAASPAPPRRPSNRQDAPGHRGPTRPAPARAATRCVPMGSVRAIRACRDGTIRFRWQHSSRGPP